MNTAAEVQKLRKIAVERYEVDGGTMHECTDEQGYVDLIAEYGTAEAAWLGELEILAISRENGGYFERDFCIEDTDCVDIPMSTQEKGNDYYGSDAHAMFGDAWFYRDCPEAY